jgi:uncharacterized membrane protein YfcA
LIAVFAVLELMPFLRNMSFKKRYMPLGGVISGFFGGLSGNQGAFRSAFLIKSGLGKEEFIGTGAVISVIIDFARLIVYGIGFYSASFSIINIEMASLICASILFAFMGAFIGSRLVKKITLTIIQNIVAGMMILIGIGMMIGII